MVKLAETAANSKLLGPKSCCNAFYFKLKGKHFLNKIRKLIFCFFRVLADKLGVPRAT